MRLEYCSALRTLLTAPLRQQEDAGVPATLGLMQVRGCICTSRVLVTENTAPVALFADCRCEGAALASNRLSHRCSACRVLGCFEADSSCLHPPCLPGLSQDYCINREQLDYILDVTKFKTKVCSTLHTWLPSAAPAFLHATYSSTLKTIIT